MAAIAPVLRRARSIRVSPVRCSEWRRDLLVPLLIAMALHLGIIVFFGIIPSPPVPEAQTECEGGFIADKFSFPASAQPFSPSVSIPTSLPVPQVPVFHSVATPPPLPDIQPALITTESTLATFAAPRSEPASRLQAHAVSPTRPAAPRAADPAQTAAANGDSGGKSGNLAIHYVYNPHPFYPAEARVAHQQGLVIIGVEISPTGRVRSAEIIRSSGFPLLDEAALKAVRLWIFSKGRRDGVSVGAHVDVPVRFSLSL